MKNLKSLCSVVAMVSGFGIGCTTEKSEPVAQKAPQARTAASAGSVSGEIIVVTENALAVAGLKKKYDVLEVNAEDGVYLISGDSIKGREAKVVEELERTGQYDIVEPNFVYKGGSVSEPRDPKWLDLWALKNYGQDAPSGIEGKKGADIGALEAWATTKGSHEIRVAVIDTGVDYNHPDLRANIWRNEKEINGVPGQDDDGNGFADDKHGWDVVSGPRRRAYHGQLGDPDPMDDQGHGTHCAGTIGAVGNNREGVTGVNWHVSIIPIKYLDDGGSGTAIDLYRAFQYLLSLEKVGVDVDAVNASFGGGGKSQLIENMLKRVEAAGILFIAAAGNSSQDTDSSPAYPASYDVDGVMSVAATDNRDQLASFSNFGRTTVDLAAPGVSVMSTYPVELARKEGDSTNPYRAFSGTSMAAPHVVGAAALVLAADRSLRNKPLELKSRLMKTGDWLPQLSGRTASGARLNLKNAVGGTVGQSQLPATGWKEYTLPTPVVTPRYPTEHMDVIWTIETPEPALAVSAHIQEGAIDSAYDLARFFDASYLPVMSVNGMVFDKWTPAVQGGKLYLKFANGLVTVQEYLGIQKVADPSTLSSNSNCWKEPTDTEYTCSVYEDESKPFPNFTSDGITIDKIRYLPKAAVQPPAPPAGGNNGGNQPGTGNPGNPGSSS